MASGNTNNSAFLTGVTAVNNGIIRINHAQSHAHLSQIEGTGGTNDLLIGYYASHYWAGNIPNPQYPTCAESTAAACNAAQGSYGGFCRWDPEILGGRCLDDRCTQAIGAWCSLFDQCEFRDGICRVRPTLGGTRFTKADLNAMRPWCEPDNCL